MIIGLHILKHTYALSDNEICAKWVDNPYFQYLCGEVFCQHDIPTERSSMTHWLKRVGDESLRELLQESLALALKTYDQHKLLSWHAGEIECISKGKAHKPYEFGCKESVITTVKPSKAGHFVLQSTAMHGNPYDGHTLTGAIDQYVKDIGVKPQRIYVDKGYKGHDLSLKLNVFKSGQKHLAPQIKKEMKRRPVIAAGIGHLKNDGHLRRNYLKGRLGDKINAISAAIGHNFRLLMTWFRELLFFIYYMAFKRNLIFRNLAPLNPIIK